MLATTYRDGTNCLIGQDPARTASNFALHSARDGQRMLEIQSRVHETMVEFNELSSFSPHPDPSLLPRVFELCAYAMDFPVEQMMEMTGPELCERTFSSDACRQILMTPVAFWEHGAPFARGQGAFGTTFALYYTTGLGIGGNEVQVDALNRCFLDHGGEVWTSALVSSLLFEDGRAGAHAAAASVVRGHANPGAGVLPGRRRGAPGSPGSTRRGHAGRAGRDGRPRAGRPWRLSRGRLR